MLVPRRSEPVLLPLGYKVTALGRPVETGAASLFVEFDYPEGGIKRRGPRDVQNGEAA